MTRDAMNIDLKDAAVIIDEAHNIEDVAREAAGLELRYDDVLETCAHLEQLLVVDDEGAGDEVNYTALESVVRGLKEHMLKWVPLLEPTGSASTSHYISSGEEAAAVLNEVGVTTETLKVLDKILDTAFTKMEEQVQALASGGAETQGGGAAAGGAGAGRRGGGLGVSGSVGVGADGARTGKALLMVKDILTKAAMLFSNADDYKMALLQRTVRDNSGGAMRGGRGSGRGGRSGGGSVRLELTLCLWCLNPGVAFRQVSERARAVILTSGTLSPLTSFSSELCTPFHAALQTPHVIDTASQVWVGSVGVGPAPASVRLNATYKNQDSMAFQDALGATVLDLCRTIPRGVLWSVCRATSAPCLPAVCLPRALPSHLAAGSAPCGPWRIKHGRIHRPRLVPWRALTEARLLASGAGSFFPSYALMDKMVERWTASGLLDRLRAEKHVVMEPRSGGAEALDKVMASFYQAVAAAGGGAEGAGPPAGRASKDGGGSKKSGCGQGRSLREGFQVCVYVCMCVCVCARARPRLPGAPTEAVRRFRG